MTSPEEENGVIIVSSTEEKYRLDKLLVSHFPLYSRTYFQSLIHQGLVLVNGKIVKKANQLTEGDEIEIEFALSPEISVAPEKIPLEILYEDADLICVNKPAGMVVHPAVGNWSGTFVNALLYHCQHLPHADSLRPGIVHRLDKETSGVLVAAKTDVAHARLVEAFASRNVKKEYLAICIGAVQERIIEAPIGRHITKRKEMTIREGGKLSKTSCFPLAFEGRFSLVRLVPETGRTHQLRVHLKHIGHPILGDSLYGSLTTNSKFHASRQLLHAHRLCFFHPTRKELLEVKAPIPQDMQSFISRFFPDAHIDPERNT